MAGTHCMSSDSARSSPIKTHTLPVNSYYRDMDVFFPFALSRGVQNLKRHLTHLPCDFSFFLSLLYLQTYIYSHNILTRLCISVLFCSCLRNSLSLSLLRRAPYSWELVLVFGSSHPSLTSV